APFAEDGSPRAAPCGPPLIVMTNRLASRGQKTWQPPWPSFSCLVCLSSPLPGWCSLCPCGSTVMVQTIVFDFGNVIGFFDYGITTGRLARHSHLSSDDIRRFLYGGELEDAYESGRISSAEFLRRVRAGCGLTCDDDALTAAYVDMFWPN